MNKFIMTDGNEVKTLDPFTDNTPGVWVGGGQNTAQTQAVKLLPSVFSGLSARMSAMADLPFTIYSAKGDKPLDNSDAYKNVVGFLPYPAQTFGLTEGSLVIAGQAYWYKEKGVKTGQVKSLKYWNPSSVKLDSDKAKKGEIFFTRSGNPQLIPADEVLYTWLSDPDVELGPPNIYPLASAMLAAGAGGAIMKFISDYMSRGAVKAMLLMVDGMPPPGEVERMETWFNRFMSGVKNMGWKVFNSAGVKPTIVGDGLEALKDLSITKELRYDIHTALGTRHLLEDENFATANARERQFYTITIVPDARLIQNSYNEQILHAMGYHLEFEPQRLEIFQDNEAETSKSFMDLFNGLREVLPVEVSFQLASEKLDYQFTDEQMAMILKGIADKGKAAEVIPPAPVVPEVAQPEAKPVPPAVVKQLVELDKWERKVSAAGKMITWHEVDLSSDIAEQIQGGSLSFADARKAIGTINDTPTTDAPPPRDDTAIKSLAAAINAAMMNNDAQPVNVTVHNHPAAAPIVNVENKSADSPAPIINVNVPEQAAPNVNIQPAAVTVNVPEQPAPVVNNAINVQPAQVVIPAMPTEATITTDARGNKTLKVKK